MREVMLLFAASSAAVIRLAAGGLAPGGVPWKKSARYGRSATASGAWARESLSVGEGAKARTSAALPASQASSSAESFPNATRWLALAARGKRKAGSVLLLSSRCNCPRFGRGPHLAPAGRLSAPRACSMPLRTFCTGWDLGRWAAAQQMSRSAKPPTLFHKLTIVFANQAHRMSATTPDRLDLAASSSNQGWQAVCMRFREVSHRTRLRCRPR